jgi:hypothetical protein
VSGAVGGQGGTRSSSAVPCLILAHSTP